MHQAWVTQKILSQKKEELEAAAACQWPQGQPHGKAPCLSWCLGLI